MNKENEDYNKINMRKLHFMWKRLLFLMRFWEMGKYGKKRIRERMRNEEMNSHIYSSVLLSVFSLSLSLYMFVLS